MKNLVINNRSYSYAQWPEELTLQAWQRVMNYRNKAAGSEDTATAGSDELQELGDRILEDIVGIRPCILQKTDPKERQRFLSLWSETIARESSERMGGKQNEEARHEAQKRCKKEKIAWPGNSRSPDNIRTPLSGICAQAFCDATDLYLADPVNYAAHIAAILCYPAKQPYKDTAVLARAERMKSCSMRIVLALLDELKEAHRLCREWFPRCYRNRLQESPKTGNDLGEPVSWNDTLLWLADYRPSEIRRTEQLSCYEFMRILDSKLRNRSNERPALNDPTYV